MELQRPGAGALGTRGQRGGNQFETIVEPRRNTVNRSNERARSTTDHT
jgi:hypothetical protein